MPKATYIEYGGTVHELDVPLGESLMQAAVSNGVPGIDGDCGGQCACATCQVYVDAPWLDGLPPPEEAETEMLNFASSTQDNSRLACQIHMTDALAGIVVRMPDGQH